MFHDWENFYLIIGPAAGGLIGLLFVVASLSTGRERSAALRGASIYMTPTVFHFGVVLVLSAMTSVPALPAHALAAIAAGLAVAGLAYSVIVAVRILSPSLLGPPHWSDVHCYGCAPAAGYAVLAAAAGGIWLGDRAAPYLLGFSLLAILLLGIRNAWDLVTYLAPGSEGSGAPPAADSGRPAS